MKKLVSIVILIFVVYNISCAGTKRKRYKVCFFGTKYSTLADVWRNTASGPVDYHQSGCDNCSGCYSYVRNSPSVAAEAWAVSKSNEFWSLIKIYDKRYQAGNNPYKLLGNYYKQPSKTNINTFLQKNLKLYSLPPPPYDGIVAKDSSSDVVFDSINRTITLTDYFANLRINQDTVDLYFVNLSITGIYNKQGDGDDSNDSIFETINVYMEGSNTPVVTGISSSNFIQSISSEEIIVSFVGGDIVLSVPSNVDFEKVGVSVYLDGGRIPDVGEFVLSDQKKLDSKPQFECKNIFPNPVANLLNVSIYSSKKTTVSIRIIDFLGKEIFSEKNIPFYQGNNLRQIPAEYLKPGTYFLILNDGKRDYQIKFVKNVN